ncbi:MAG: MauE/DoxX family redox-associated membrane protein [Myxococcales bacterium]
MLPTRVKVKQYGSLALRVVVAAVFVDAAANKILDPAAFAENTGNYQLLPEISNYIAIVLPSTELLTALVLVLGRKHWRNAAVLTFFGMLVVFTTAITRAWASGINLECGCFGAGSSTVGIVPVLRNLGLIAALLLSLWLDWTGWGVASRTAAAPE